jgi:hypothetical protein
MVENPRGVPARKWRVAQVFPQSVGKRELRDRGSDQAKQSGGWESGNRAAAASPDGALFGLQLRAIIGDLNRKMQFAVR